MERSLKYGSSSGTYHFDDLKSLLLKVSAEDFEYDGLYVHFFMELPKCKLIKNYLKPRYAKDYLDECLQKIL
jgi:hypothetical protein